MTDLIRILIAPLVWLASFSVIYGLQGLSCTQNSKLAQGFVPDWQIVLLLAWLAALAAQLILFASLRRQNMASSSLFVNHISQAMIWSAIVATLWTLFPIMLMAPCT